MKNIFLLTLAFFAFSSCQSDDSQDPGPELMNIDFESVMKSEFSGEPIAAGEFIINTNAEWADFTALANSVYIGQWEPLDGISIDFENHTAIAVVHDFFGYGGHFIEITSIDEAGGTIYVQVSKSESFGGDVTMIHCQPYQIVTIPKTTLPVTFEYD